MSQPPVQPPSEILENQTVNNKRQSRTIFTSQQKNEMRIVAEKIGWKSESKRQREEDEVVHNFIKHSGVSSKAFKLWMQNNKKSNTWAESSSNSIGSFTYNSSPSMATHADVHRDKENIMVTTIPCSIQNEETQIKDQMDMGTRSPLQTLVLDHSLPTINDPVLPNFPSNQHMIGYNMENMLQPPTQHSLNFIENPPTFKQIKSRTTFTTEQKDKMKIVAEKIGWKIHSKTVTKEDEEVDKLIEHSGVNREAFKQWMKNHRKSNALSQGSFTFNCSSSMTTAMDVQHGKHNEVIHHRVLDNTERKEQIGIDIRPPLQNLMSDHTPMQQLIEDNMTDENDNDEEILPIYINTETINQASSSCITPTQNNGFITGEHMNVDDNIDDDQSPEIVHGTAPPPCIPTERHYLGLMDVLCPNCKAFHWIDERLSDSSKQNPLFGTCCRLGKIKLPFLIPPPTPLKVLYDGCDSLSKSFRKYIRQYNTENAFTSLGCDMDDRALGGRGPKSFTIHGELRHRTGALLPEIGEPPIYSQLYIYDPDVALNIRHDRNQHLNRDVLRIIQDVLIQHNQFTKIYHHVFDILSQLNTSHTLSTRLHYSTKNDKRVYNMPTTNEIDVILPGDGSQVSGPRDIILHLKSGGHLQRISECHPAYLPLHYVLLFPHGELGWDINYTQWDPLLNCPTDTRLTQLQYFRYRIFERVDEYSTILRGWKLCQQYIVDAWASLEQNRLHWTRTHQTELRRDLYCGITDVETDMLHADQIGNRYILPSSFTGSPRHMYEIYQDSMAITRYNKHPDIFLTMTANPNWPEVNLALKQNQNTYDRPDIVARVFELKRRSLMDMVVNQDIFGKVVAHVYTIEFQKRGLPHMHALIFLHPSDNIQSIEQVDKLISAEFPNENENPLLFKTIKKCMIHGPCKGNATAMCIENGKCSKRYPRDWAENTMMDRDGYPIYHRRNDGRSFVVNGVHVDNRDVVPYNPKLSEMYDCHINVEACVSVRAVKYIHKYIYKGHDRTTMILGAEDEIKQYIDSRYIGPPEAAWRIFGYHMHEEKPPVIRLQLHLPGMHQVTFNPQDCATVIQQRAETQTSTLIEFFNHCKLNPDAREFTYQQFSEHFTWNKSTKKWSPRCRDLTAIGRMYFASPNSGERFYLRLLLTVVKGPISFEDLRTVDGVIHDTFKSACVAKGLLEDDEEWIMCLEEAAIMNTGSQLRRLFSIILTQCLPINPLDLWNRFSMHICDDLGHKIRTTYYILEPTDDQIKDYGLFLLNKLLEESGKSLLDFPPMTLPTRTWNVVVPNRLIWEHRQLQHDIQPADVQKNVDRFNDEQRLAYNVLMASVQEDKGLGFFLNGEAGTGKTFLYNTIASKCRTLGHIVITVASSGIASLLLAGGRTEHSTFSLPLNILEDSNCGFTKQSITAELLRETRLIIWDEVPMQHRFCVEAVDRSLQDFRNSNNVFGGITVVLGGDFRQVLPVIPRGLREEIVAATLKRSILWIHLTILTLHKNMRLTSDDFENDNFAKFLTQVGSNPEQTINLPPSMHKCENLDKLIHKIYPHLDVVGTTSPDFLTARTILSARNEDVNSINYACLRLFPGEYKVFLAADKLNEDEENDRYPSEFLNSLDCNGLPPFDLKLKIGYLIMLLRNLAPKDGLCNGTRLVVVQLGLRIIEAKILTGDKAGNLVFIPRISLQPSSSEMTVNMTRRQFPIRLAYSMTINKAQGQSVKYVGIDLRTPVFSHGQLYVALSRCTTFNRISILPSKFEDCTTTNVVYPEVLL